MRKYMIFFLILILLVLYGVSAASAQGFKVQLLEEGTEFTQFMGGWPWDISAPCYMYILADCGSRYHVLIPSTGFGWPIDWNGTYGYVLKDDRVVIRTSILDLIEPEYSAISQQQEQRSERTEDEITACSGIIATSTRTVAAMRIWISTAEASIKNICR